MRAAPERIDGCSITEKRAVIPLRIDAPFVNLNHRYPDHREGYDPFKADRRLYRQVKAIVADAFRRSEERERAAW